MALEPPQGLGPDPRRAGREQDYRQMRREQTKERGHLINEGVVAGCGEERLPIGPWPLQEVLTGGGVGQDPVEVEGDSGTLARPSPPSPNGAAYFLALTEHGHEATIRWRLWRLESELRVHKAFV